MGKYPLKKLAERYFPANFVHRPKRGFSPPWRTGCAAHCARCYAKRCWTTTLWHRFLFRSSSERCGNSTAAAAATSPAFGALLLMFGCCAGTIVSVAVDRSKKSRPKSSGGKFARASGPPCLHQRDGMILEAYNREMVDELLLPIRGMLAGMELMQPANSSS